MLAFLLSAPHFIPLTMCILHYECFMISLFSIKIVCYIAENYPQHPRFFRVKNSFKLLHLLYLNTLHPPPCFSSLSFIIPSHFNFDAKKTFPSLLALLSYLHFSQFGINDCENPFTNDSRGCYYYYYMLARTPGCMSVHGEDVGLLFILFQFNYQ